MSKNVTLIKAMNRFVISKQAILTLLVVFSGSSWVLSLEKITPERLSVIQEKAAQGDPASQIILGWCYARGSGVTKDEVQAFKWYKEAANQGNAEAQILVGSCYATGCGVTKDDARAVEWYLRAARQGNAKAQYYVGNGYHLGVGLPKDLAEAIRWHRKAAEQGNPDSQAMLGSYLAENEEYIEAFKWLYLAESSRSEKASELAKVTIDTFREKASSEQIAEGKTKAIEWQRGFANIELVDQGAPELEGIPSDPAEVFVLGTHKMNGDEGHRKDQVLGLKLIERSAMQGYEEAIFDLGLRYWNGNGVKLDYDLGEKWLKKAADEDNPMAQMILAEAYYKGTKIPKNDREAIRLCRILVDAFPSFGVILGDYYSKGLEVGVDHEAAARYFRMAAEYGDEEGQMRLAYCFVEGRGVEQSDANAVRWFSRAAEQGNPLAQKCLGVAYSIGKGVDKDMAQAARWREKAANAGDVDCQELIGVHYFAGQGVPKDDVLAYKWLNLAAAAGSNKAMDLRNEVAEDMTPDQIAEAQKLSREWKVAK